MFTRHVAERRYVVKRYHGLERDTRGNWVTIDGVDLGTCQDNGLKDAGGNHSSSRERAIYISPDHIIYMIG